MRYFLELAFCGTAYHGWQIQKNAHSVQSEVEKALSTLLKEKTGVTGAGRTHTGVHARQMFCHFDVSGPIAKPESILYHFNSCVPKDICALSLRPVSDKAHARFSALSRTYRYHLTKTRNPFLNDRAGFYPYDLDLSLMRKACGMLKSVKDFSCFEKTGGNSESSECNLTSATWKESGGEVIFSVTANRFLRNMVRAMVGTMLEVGRGKMDLDEFMAVQKSGNRQKAGMSVPAHGLYLTNIRYPGNLFLKHHGGHKR